MLRVKGFVSINSLISNIESKVSVIGELSPISRTYSKDIGEYASSVYQGYRLQTFSAIDSVTNKHKILAATEIDFCIGVVRAIHTYALTNTRPYNNTNFKVAVRNEFLATLNTLEFGEYVDNGTLALPEWVEFSHTVTGAVYRIWLADEAFQQQYDLYSIEIVPFFSNLDDFFHPYGSVSSALDLASLSSFMEKIQTKRNKNPETVLHIMDFNIVNIQYPAQTRKVSWGILIYGAAGDNIDSIKDAIIDYLVKNSSHTSDEWEQLFPDIFKRTEFTIYPRWDKVAIENLTNLSEIYSSICDYQETVNFAMNAADHYPNMHVRENMETLQHIHKFVSLIAIPGVTNTSDIRKLGLMYKDYLPVQNTALDYGRMSENTRNWSGFLTSLIQTAEYATKYNTIPTWMRRAEKNGKLYITAVFNDVNYIVAAKNNEMYQ